MSDIGVMVATYDENEKDNVMNVAREQICDKDVQSP